MIVMKERLLEFLRSENKSSAQFAEEIGVQPSGISHILSGRNNPSLDFILKMLEKYPFISTDWLLFGKGNMYREPKMQTLFDEGKQIDGGNYNASAGSEIENRNNTDKPGEKEPVKTEAIDGSYGRKSGVLRIVMFYDDNSFKEYFPQE